MGISDKRYEAQYAADMKLFACVDMVVDELQTAINENGYSFDGMSNREIAEDLNRFSPAAELWGVDMIEAAMPMARSKLG